MALNDVALHTLNLCSGYDGLGIALDIATGGQTRAVCHVEIEVPAALVLADAMGKGLLPEAPIWSDLRTFDGVPWRGIVDIVVAGYPCQPFSVAGKRGGESDPRHLWPEVARIMEEVQPTFGFFENVGGHLRLGFDAVCEDLERLGYHVAAGLFTASEVGASHKRERLFILAHREDFDRGLQLCGGRSNEGRDEPGGCGEAMADPSRLCEHGRERARSGSVRGIRQASEGVGDPCECGQRRELADAKIERGELAGGSRERRSGLEDYGCVNMANCWCDRLQGFRETGSATGPAIGSDRVPIFPPGPSDPQWGRIIEQWPDLAPAVESSLCRVVDGRPARVDQLRMLGNGVVPLQGAYAFCALSAVLGFGGSH